MPTVPLDVARLEPVVNKVARRFVHRNSVDMNLEDLRQEAWLGVLLALPAHDPGKGSLEGFARRAAWFKLMRLVDDRNRGMQGRVKRGLGPVNEALPAETVGPIDPRSEEPVDTVGRRELLRLVREAIGLLPEKLSAAARGCFLDGRRPDDVAEQEGVSERMIRRRLKRAQEELRNLVPVAAT
jgi:RNA polymerase sigma factor (sigma-70 family)